MTVAAPRVGAAVLVAPLRIEARALRHGAPHATVVHTGMRGSTLPPGDRPIVVAGFGGALAGDLAPGTVVVADEVVSPEGDVLRCDTAIAGTVDGARVGRIASARGIVRGAERARLAAGGAIAVDMESYWLREAAGERPFVAVRVIVDTPYVSVANPFAMLRAGVPAYRVLRQVAGSLAAWSPSTLSEPDE